MAANAKRPEFVVVPMSVADLDPIMEIERQSFRSPWSRQVFVEERGREWAHVDLLKSTDVAGGGPTVLGFVNFWLVRDEVHILNVACHAEHRRKGHGSRLLSHAIEFGRQHGCRYVTLEVRRSNLGAIRMYRRFGFRAVGIRPNYYIEDNEDAILMLLELQ